MNVLLLGSGGREHAFAKNISKSALLTKLFIAPGNAGTSQCGENVDIKPTDFNNIYQFCINNNISLIIPGNEDPLVAGIVDFVQEKNTENTYKILVAGPNKYAAQLEGSKAFSKEFMIENNIPTAQFKKFTNEQIEEAKNYIESRNAPFVLKADGLAAGKGVLIENSIEDAKKSVEELLSGKFGDASKTVVIEDFLQGIEISVFVVSDGNSWQFLGSAKDYKRIGNNDEGLNTGGMGAISPVYFADEIFIQKVADKIVNPTINGMKKRGNPFKGFLFLGLMNNNGEPWVIEYNVRMGDPETEAIFPRLETDLLQILEAVATEKLHETKIQLSADFSAIVFLVSKGYPENFEKGFSISYQKEIEGNLFFAGATKSDNHIVSAGGRVVAVNGTGSTMEIAIKNAYENVEKINFNNKYFRTDIGKDLTNAQLQ